MSPLFVCFSAFPEGAGAFRPLNRPQIESGFSRGPFIKRFVTGHDFSRAVTAAKNLWALAPEACFSGLSQIQAGCPTLATSLCLSLGWDTTNLNQHSTEKTNK